MKAPSASPPRSKSLISSPCSRMIWPIRPGPGSMRCRAHSANRNSRDSPTAPMTAWPPWVTSKRAEPSLRNVSRVLLPQAEELADHQEGDREREGLDQVGDPVVRGGRRLGLVELLRDDPVDLGLEPGQPAHRELRGQQLAQTGVLGRVGEAEAADVAVGLTGLAVVGPDVGGVRREVTEHLARLGVAGHQPDVHAEEGDQLRDRVAVAQLGDPRHGIGDDPVEGPGQPVGDAVELGEVDAAGTRHQAAADGILHSFQQRHGLRVRVSPVNPLSGTVRGRFRALIRAQRVRSA